ncbi:beta-1,3-galactosyltransferase 5-like [Glandiceps talaboti]
MSNSVEKYVLVLVLVGFVNILLYILFTKASNLVNPALEREQDRIFDNINFLSGKDVNTGDIGYLVNEEKLCVGKDISLVSLITSRTGNFWQRGAIRRTWTTEKEVDGQYIISVFLLAKTAHVGNMRSVQDESANHHDIILFDYQEDYLNLTLKTLLGFKWMSHFCGNVSYILKTDDDVFMNYRSLVRNLQTRQKENLALGQIFNNASTVRNKASKWFTSLSDYKSDTYPPFLVGTGYVLSRDLVLKVLKLAPSLIFLNWEDVFVGMCLHKLGVRLIDDVRFYQEIGRLNTQEAKCKLQYIFKIHNVSYQRQKWLWHTLSSMRQNNLCPVTSDDKQLKM